MREILFRGKRIDNGEWVEGYYLQFHDMHIIIPTKAKDSEHFYLFDFAVEVIPETVGQSTGLTDKNGKKIFEGDSLDCITSDYDGSDKPVCGFITDITDFQQMGFLECCHEIEVIGNIFDNPGLIGGEQT